MFTRRHTRPLAAACAIAALAIAPTAASARPAPYDPPLPPDSTTVEPVPVERQVQPDGDRLAILLSGAALVVAAAGAGIAGRSQRQVARIAGPHA